MDRFEWFLVCKVSRPCDLPIYLCACACFVGHGRSRGAGLSHAAAGVLRRSVEFVGSPASRESEDQ